MQIRRYTESFSPFTPLVREKDIKSTNYDKDSQRIIYTKAEEGWWTFNIYLKNPDKTIKIPEIKMYKVRTKYELK